MPGIYSFIDRINPVSICSGLLIFAISIASLVQFSVSISLKNSTYQYLSSDLRNILTPYTNCHMHIFLATDDDVDIDSVRAPIYLTVPNGKYFENVSKTTPQKFRDFVGDMKTLTPTAVGACLANVFVVTNVKLLYSFDDFLHLNKRMLNQRGNSLITPVVNILLMNLRYLYQGWIIREHYTLAFSGFYGNVAGSGFSIGILYDLEQWASTTAGTCEQWDNTKKAVLILCNHCLRVHTIENCPPGTGHNCFLIGMAKVNEMAENGKAIRWVVMRVQWRMKGNYKLCELAKTYCTYGDWRRYTLYKFMTQSINESLLAKPSTGYRQAGDRIRKLPRIGWTKDGITGALYTTPLLQIYTQRFPLEPDHQLQDNFKFITVDIVEKYSNSIFFYTTPLELPVWLLTLFATVSITMAITATVTQLMSVRTVLSDMSTTTFWVFGVLTDQADACKLEPRQKSGHQGFTALLCVAVSMNLFVVNMYKCMFSTNLIIGTEYEPRIERLDGLLKDFKIYFPIDEQLKTTVYHKYHVANLSKYDHWIKLYAACGVGYQSTSIAAACTMAELMSQYLQAVPGCDDEIYDILNSKNPHVMLLTSRFCPPDAKVVVNLWLQSKFEYADEIVDRLLNVSEADRNKVALVTTEEHLPVLWSELKGKMARKPNLRFAHTMNSPRDNTTRRREHMILVSSGMKSAYTNVVSRYAHALMSSGIWSHWTGRVRWLKGIERSRTFQAFELRSDSFNRAPMIIFWTWGTLCTVLMVLFGVEVLFVGKGWRYSLRYVREKVTHCKAIPRWISGVGRSYVWTVKKVRRLYGRI